MQKTVEILYQQGNQWIWSTSGGYDNPLPYWVTTAAGAKRYVKKYIEDAYRGEIKPTIKIA